MNKFVNLFIARDTGSLCTISFPVAAPFIVGNNTKTSWYGNENDNQLRPFRPPHISYHSIAQVNRTSFPGSLSPALPQREIPWERGW